MSVPGVSPPILRHIPFWETVGQCIRFVLSNLPTLVVLGWGPFIVVAATSYVLVFQELGYVSLSFVPTALVNLLSLLALAVFSVNWHRFVILGEVWKGPESWLTKRNLPFIGYTMALIFLPGQLMGMLQAGAAPGRGTAGPVALLLMVPLLVGMFALLRFYLVFPAAAVERNISFGDAWNRMNGNTWRLFWGTCVVGLVLTLPFIPLEIWESSEIRDAAAARARGESVYADLPIYAHLTPFARLLSCASAVTVLSRIYLHIMGLPQPASAGPAPTPSP